MRTKRTRSRALCSEGLRPAIFGLILCWGLAGGSASADQATAVGTTDAACAKCHSAIFKSYVATPMANASGAANERLRPGRFVHTASETEYTVAEKNGQAELSFRSLKTAGIAGEFPLSYFLGSGHLGTTYLYSIGNFLFESPVAWYAPSKSYDMKPGLAELDRMPPPLPMQSGCLRCHMSSVQPSDAGTINRYRGLAFLHTGITCEACHGDAEKHLSTDGKAAIVNPAKLAAGQRDSVCISCHLEGDVSVERAGHSALNYRPGESISTYLAFYVKRDSNITDRGVSEVEQLSQSMCKRTSGDRMSCTSCHDPHYTPDPSQKAAFFRSKCLACHNQPEFAASHHPENRDCTSCHMPRSGAENIPHVAWTDHRIRRRPDDSKAELQTPTGGELTPIFSPTATPRDLAMANYQALLGGDRTREAIAWEQLNALGDSINNDAAALDALGNLSAERGDGQKAEQLFRRVLDLDPNDLTALSNLGVLLAKQGKLTQSIGILRKAFDKNQDIPSLSMNLARVQCAAGDGAAARSTLNTALTYSGNLEDMRQLLSEMNDCGAADAK